MQDQEPNQTRSEAQALDPAFQWLTITQVAEELQTQPNNVRKMVNSGQLEALRTNRQFIRIQRSALLAMVSRQKGGEFGLWATK
jgi:excisionase family DNA binding protein